MLRQRIFTALLLIPPLVAAFFFFPSWAIAVLFGIVSVIGAWEWSGLCGWNRPRRLLYVAALAILGSVAVVAVLQRVEIAYLTFGTAAAAWVLALLELRTAKSGLLATETGRIVVGLAILIGWWTALTFLNVADPYAPFLLLYIFVLVAVADTAAYAAGHAFGRTKLAPAISPGKTVEGVGGGVFAVVLLSYLCGTMLWRLEGLRLVEWIALSTVTGLISVIGDLIESKMKRIAGVKDSGTLLPGHGGILDRIDAVTAGAPVFAFGWLALFGARA